jgi:hypothetical protein
MTIRYCCDWIQDKIERRGDRGFAIATTTAPTFFGSALVFVLETRAVSAADLDNAKISADCPIELWSKVCIKFCPSCGVRLAKHYARFRAELPLVPDLLKEFGVSM